ncbi:MAG: MotA/TolQ/ExbB proton channel family protein [Deferribacteres bacterium]|nr:MotA/TolQ/ExbB proton channel family protein [candidate division KSB1 bacterium]MCB9510877.1 MotA/TolQ/ExbB proton channel family protein [Deferribacteres bacterium]
MESIKVVWDFITSGGLAMIPLALCSLIGLAIVIEKLITMRTRKVIVPEIVSVLDNVTSEKDLSLAQSICKKHNGPFPTLILTVLQNSHLQKDELKELVLDTGRQEIRMLERGLVALETIAGVAPLLGLLGTVIGILKVFNVIAELGIGEASALSGGISEALITTIVGLSIGIPAVVFFNYFSDRAENLVLEIEKYSSDLIMKVKQFSQGGVEVSDAA